MFQKIRRQEKTSREVAFAHHAELRTYERDITEHQVNVALKKGKFKTSHGKLVCQHAGIKLILDSHMSTVVTAYKVK